MRIIEAVHRWTFRRGPRVFCAFLFLLAMAGSTCGFRAAPPGAGLVTSTVAGQLVTQAEIRFCGKPGDCNCNDVADRIDLENGTSEDCNANDIPDECDENDCNENRLPDSCDIAEGRSTDLNGNGLPDECEDCNENGVPDDFDVSGGTSGDCDGDGLLDECEFDCDGNGIADECELADGTATDVNQNNIPDACDIAAAVCSEFGNGLYEVIDAVRADRAAGYTRAEITEFALTGCARNDLYDSELNCTTCLLAIIDLVYK